MELLASAEPDLIFLDLLMPGQTGVSLYAEIVDHPRLRDRPVVILSGLDRRRGAAARCSGGPATLPAPAASSRSRSTSMSCCGPSNALLGRPTGVAP